MQRNILLLLSLLLLAGGCRRNTVPDPETVRQIIKHRNLGLAYLEENKLAKAGEEFHHLTEIAPGEPLGFANLGLTYLRRGDFEQAERWFTEALDLAPANPDILFSLAVVYESTGREAQAIQALERTLEVHPNHVRTLFQLAQHYKNSRSETLSGKTEVSLTRVVHALPANMVARLQLLELLLQNQKAEQAVQHMEIIRQILPRLPDGSVQVFQNSLEFMRTNNPTDAFTAARRFHNLLKATSFYRAAIAELRGIGVPPAGEPLRRFSEAVTLPAGQERRAPNAFRFTDATGAGGLDLSSSTTASSQGEVAISPMVLTHGDFDGDGDQDLFVSQLLEDDKSSRQYLFSNTEGVFSDVAAVAGIAHSGRDFSATFADYDNDGYLDLFITNSVGNRLYHNSGAGTFEPVKVDLGPQRRRQDLAVVIADLDLEGDLDIFIGSDSGNRLYRNNSDESFSEVGDEAGLRDEMETGRSAVFADFDDDGDSDLFLTSQARGNRYYDNLRQGFFREITQRTGLATETRSGAVAAGDYNNDGYLDLFVTDLDGRHHALYRNIGDGTFERDAGSDSALAAIEGVSGLDAAFFDADNDGFLDLVVAGDGRDGGANRPSLALLYNDGEGTFSDASARLPDFAQAVTNVDVADYDNDGDLDLFLAGPQAGLRLLRNDGGNINNYLVVRLAGMRTGSAKNNFFGIGAKVEVKAGALYQVHSMNAPVAHFGLGDRAAADMVRVVWSNGVPQNWFDPERNLTIVEDQTLKGSCPWLFAWNGEDYEFVTDVLWSSALGMPLGIMGKEMGYASPNSSNDYMKVPGEKLAPQDGEYALRFTSELWETSFVDQIKFVAVDHPDSVSIYIDEKFSPPPYGPFRIYSVADQRLPESAEDGEGTDVLAEITHIDGEYISNFVPGRYQGLTEPHDLILNLGDLSQADSVFLFLYGWIFPTDASINVNMGQSSSLNSEFPVLQVPDRNGQWRTVVGNLGFPKGKNKTVIADLSNKFLTEDYRVRIRTNMQIYWDQIFYSTRLPATFRQTTLDLASADLHFRGFSEVSRKDPYSPHIPDYHSVSKSQKWRDLTGSYTRYGDVLSLLLASDSKYIIMNAGDEIRLRFDASGLPELPGGWSRDFLLYNDGWVKDGDLNTAHGQTVEPLPFHGMTAYPYGPQDAYPSSPEYVEFLETYNTRKVDTEEFRRFVFNFRSGK